MSDLSTRCTSCKTVIAFPADAVEGLEDLIREERSEATDLVLEQQGGWGDPICPVILDGARPIHELAIAIRNGDCAEAEHWLDQIAEQLGNEAQEQVQQGRFSPRARKVL